MMGYNLRTFAKAKVQKLYSGRIEFIKLLQLTSTNFGNCWQIMRCIEWQRRSPGNTHKHFAYHIEGTDWEWIDAQRPITHARDGVIYFEILF